MWQTWWRRCEMTFLKGIAAWLAFTFLVGGVLGLLTFWPIGLLAFVLAAVFVWRVFIEWDKRQSEWGRQNVRRIDELKARYAKEAEEAKRQEEEANRRLSNAKGERDKWALYLGMMLDTFSAPGQVIDHDPGGTAFSDTCLICGGDTRPDRTVTEGTLTRGYYHCRLQHPSGELPAWWTDWKSSEVVDRQVIFPPDLVGGGNTWSTVQLGKKWGDEVSDLVEWLRPAEEAEAQ